MANDEKKQKKNNHFFKDFKAELKKVIWPTPKQLVNNTIAVLTIVLILAIIVFFLDIAFEALNTYGIDKIRNAVSTSAEQSEQNSSVEENKTENNSTSNNTTENSKDKNNTTENKSTDNKKENNTTENKSTDNKTENKSTDSKKENNTTENKSKK